MSVVGELSGDFHRLDFETSPGMGEARLQDIQGFCRHGGSKVQK
jgi:hypothetical protein